MNELFAQMRTLGERIPSQAEHLDSIEAVKNALVLPIFQALGYDVFDTSEFLPAPGPELVGLPSADGPDFVVLKDAAPVFLVECRKTDEGLLPIPATRSAACFPHGTASVVVYTNGVQVQVHTDLAQPGRLDLLPVMSFDLRGFREEEAFLLPWLVKGNFDPEAFRRDAADVSRIFPRLIEQAEQELASPSPELVRLLAAKVYRGPVSPEIEAELGKLVRKAFKKLIRDRIRERLVLAISLDGPPEDRVDEVERMFSPTTNLDSLPAAAPSIPVLHEIASDEKDFPADQAERPGSSRAAAWALGILLLGAAGWAAWRWVGPTPPPIPAIAAPPAEPSTPAAPQTPQAPAEPPSPKPGSESLRKIEAGDLPGAAELGRQKIALLDKDHWSLRLDIAFESRTALNLVKALPGQEDAFFLVPIRMKDGRTCYQVFFGDYDSEATAMARRSELPTWFMSQGNAPIPFRVGAIPDQQ